jgi:hypothetical protein
MKFAVGILTMACASAQQAASAPLGNGPASAVSIKSTDGEVTVIVTPLDNSTAPRVVWRDERDVRVVARIDDHQLLLQRDGKVGTAEFGTLLLLDTRSGNARQIMQCTWRNPVDVHNDRLVLLDQVKTIGCPLVSIGLQPGAKPQQIGNTEFVRRSPAHGNQVIAIEAGYRGAWKIDLRRNKCERLFEPTPAAVDISCSRSPSGQRIALGIARYDGGEIVVLDASTGKVVRRWSELQIRSDRFVPELPVGFVDDDTIASIETGKPSKSGFEHWRVTRSLTSGKELTRKQSRWAIMSMNNEGGLDLELLGLAPNWPAPQGSVLRQVRAKPSWSRLSKDKKFAVVQHAVGGDVELLGAGPRCVLDAGTVIDCSWLPALGSCTTDHQSDKPHTRYSGLPIKK